jgi:hypothetical protein
VLFFELFPLFMLIVSLLAGVALLLADRRASQEDAEEAEGAERAHAESAEGGATRRADTCRVPDA